MVGKIIVGDKNLNRTKENLALQGMRIIREAKSLIFDKSYELTYMPQKQNAKTKLS